MLCIYFSWQKRNPSQSWQRSKSFFAKRVTKMVLTRWCYVSLRIAKVPMLISAIAFLRKIGMTRHSGFKKSHPNSARLNNLIRKKLAEAGDVALEVEAQNKDLTSKAIMRKVKPSSQAKFFAQASVYLKRLEDAGNYNVWKAETPTP